MAPEVYTDQHIHGTTFDWFCTAVTLHEFLTGRRPYEATRLQRYYSNHHLTTNDRDNLELEALTKLSLSPTCVDFVSRLLHPNVSFLLFLVFLLTTLPAPPLVGLSNPFSNLPSSFFPEISSIRCSKWL
jgi:serine/threonine protein kinase